VNVWRKLKKGMGKRRKRTQRKKVGGFVPYESWWNKKNLKAERTSTPWNVHTTATEKEWYGGGAKGRQYCRVGGQTFLKRDKENQKRKRQKKWGGADGKHRTQTGMIGIERNIENPILLLT